MKLSELLTQLAQMQHDFGPVDPTVIVVADEPGVEVMKVYADRMFKGDNERYVVIEAET